VAHKQRREKRSLQPSEEEADGMDWQPKLADRGNERCKYGAIEPLQPARRRQVNGIRVGLARDAAS
jgi:hypothetical protein